MVWWSDSERLVYLRNLSKCTGYSDGNFPLGLYKWHGAVKHTDGIVYSAHADQVLKVEPGDVERKLSLLGNNIRTGAHQSDGKYKFLGGAVGGDCVYLFPSDTDYVCEVNTKTEVVVVSHLSHKYLSKQ